MNASAPSLISLWLVPALKPQCTHSRPLYQPEMRCSWEDTRILTWSGLKGTGGGVEEETFLVKGVRHYKGNTVHVKLHLKVQQENNITLSYFP